MKTRFIYYDTETTGIQTSKDRIVEIAAFDPEKNTTFHKLINPEVPIPLEASNIHHITDEMVKEAPTFSAAIPEFVDFCEGDVVLIAHNNDAFDLPMLKNEFSRSQSSMPTWKFIDSLKWARRYRPDLPKHSLQFLREIYGIAANNAHRALDDVIVLHKVFSSMIDDLSTETVYNLLSQTKKMTHMPFGKYAGKPLKSIPKDYIKWMSSNGAFEKTENQELKEALQKLNMI